MTLNAPVSNGLEGKFKLGTTFTVAIQKGKRCKAKISTLIFIVPFFFEFSFSFKYSIFWQSADCYIIFMPFLETSQ